MRFIKTHWFGLLISLVVLFFVLVFVLVLFSPRHDVKKRGFIPCTEEMVSDMLSCENKNFCMLKVVVKNSFCDSQIIISGVKSWALGQQQTPWANYFFTPEFAPTQEPEAGLQEFYDENPHVTANMEELRKLNQNLEKEIEKEETNVE